MTDEPHHRIRYRIIEYLQTAAELARIAGSKDEETLSDLLRCVEAAIYSGQLDEMLAYATGMMDRTIAMNGHGIRMADGSWASNERYPEL